MMIRKNLAKLRNLMIYRYYDTVSRIASKKLPLDPGAKFVVSIASYPARAHLVPAVIERISRQTVMPRHLILVLTVEEWPGRILPEYLNKLVRRGLEIVWTSGNFYAVKKLVPVLEKYPDLGIITFDDDLLYNKDVIERLVECEHNNPGSIVGHVGKVMYKSGNKLHMFCRGKKPASKDTRSSQIYFLGGSGTLYPPGSLDPRVTDLKAIKRIVPGRGSDIWFWAAAIAAGTNQICLGASGAKNLYLPIPQTRKSTPRDRPKPEVLENRFQRTIDFFGIRNRLLEILPDRK